MELKPRKWPFLVPIVLAVVLLVFWSPQPGDYSLVIISCLFLLLSLVLLFVLSKTRIIISEHSLKKVSWLDSGEMAWTEINRTYIKSRFTGRSRTFFWYFENPDNKRLRFSMRLYPRKSLRILAQIILQKRASAISDERITSMAEGKFPWYII